jgi:hypothetical protein
MRILTNLIDIKINQAPTQALGTSFCKALDVHAHVTEPPAAVVAIVKVNVLLIRPVETPVARIVAVIVHPPVAAPVPAVAVDKTYLPDIAVAAAIPLRRR